jgi:hypothetical protein
MTHKITLNGEDKVLIRTMISAVLNVYRALGNR